MAKQSAIQKNINRKTLIDRLSEKRAKLKDDTQRKDKMEQENERTCSMET